MTNSTDALDTIRAARDNSESAWDGAVDGAEIDDGIADGPKYTAACDARDACLGAYEHAIEMLEVMGDGWRVAAEASLEEARTLESEYGDSGDADEALEALRECSAEID